MATPTPALLTTPVPMPPENNAATVDPLKHIYFLSEDT